MGSVHLPTVLQMTDIQQSINALIVISLVGIGGVAAAVFAALKWWIPARFKQQTEQRELQLKEMEARITRENAASAADTQRDLVLPQLVTTMNASIASQSQFFQSVGAYLQNQIDNDNRRQAELHAHSIAVTGVSEGLDELRDEFVTLKGQIEHVVTNVQTNTDSTREAKANSILAAEQTKTTLELVTKFGLKLDSITLIAKSDTKPIPVITDLSPPEDLQKTG